MNRPIPLLGALGVGAGLMYLLDPDKGKRRRALLRDQAQHLTNMTNRQIAKTKSDLRNRTVGVIAETERYLLRKGITDKKLEARVRSRLGRLISHPHSVRTEVEGGIVRLSGQVLADEVETLLHRIGRMHGVLVIENNLEVHEHAGETPGLQPNHKTNTRKKKGHSWRQPNLPAVARFLSATTGLGCVVFAAKRRGFLGSAVGVAGAELLSLGLTNSSIENLGTNTGKGIVVQKTINIDAPPEKVYEICSHPENFPHFMSHVHEVRRLKGRQFRWTVDGIPGWPAIWNTKVIQARPNEIIKWRNADADGLEQTGEMVFERKNDDSTRLHVRLRYFPGVGLSSRAVASFFGRDPKSEMDDDLIRMKTYIEKGKIPRDAVAQIQKRRCKNMKINEIMTKDPVCAVPETKLEEIAHLMFEKDCGAIPIVENQENRKPVGIVTDRDITCRSLGSGKNPMDLTAKDIMTTALLTLKPDTSLEECCELMEEKQVRRMLVVDDHGSCAGIVAQADIARTAPAYETAELVKDVSQSASAAA